jgi:hypothetical protein
MYNVGLAKLLALKIVYGHQLALSFECVQRNCCFEADWAIVQLQSPSKKIKPDESSIASKKRFRERTSL